MTDWSGGTLSGAPVADTVSSLDSYWTLSTWSSLSWSVNMGVQSQHYKTVVINDQSSVFDTMSTLTSGHLIGKHGGLHKKNLKIHGITESYTSYMMA